MNAIGSFDRSLYKHRDHPRCSKEGCCATKGSARRLLQNDLLEEESNGSSLLVGY